MTRVYSLGEISLTACVRLIFDRILKNGGRPIRILYLSDFDPAGRSIPVAAARKVEWLIRAHNLEVDFQLIPILLDHDQCVHYQLPRTPLKADEARGDDWSHQYGQGGTEIDALEALHPGEFRRSLCEAHDRYYDHDLDARWIQECAEIDNQLFDLANDVRRDYANALSPYFSEYREISLAAKDLHNRMELIFDRMAEDMTARAESLLEPLHRFRSDHVAAEHPDPLYDSLRTYEQQIARYKLFQGRNEDWAARHREKRKLKAREARAKKKAERDPSMPRSRPEPETERDSSMPRSRFAEGAQP